MQTTNRFQPYDFNAAFKPEPHKRQHEPVPTLPAPATKKPQEPELSNALMRDLLDPTVATLDLCDYHGLTLNKLIAILESPEFAYLQSAIDQISTARAKLVDSESRFTAKARLHDICKQRPTDRHHEETIRKAASKLAPTSERAKAQRDQNPEPQHQHAPAPATSPNNPSKALQANPPAIPRPCVPITHAPPQLPRFPGRFNACPPNRRWALFDAPAKLAFRNQPPADERSPTLHQPICSICIAALIAPTALAAGDAYEAPAAYYSGATGTGATLKSQLTAAMSAGHIQRNYGNFRDMSRYIDTDPNNPNNILLCYNRASVSSSWDSGSTWNREHVWPQSRQPGSASNGSTGNLGDPHALKPCNPSINSSRGNKPFGGGANTTGNYRSLGTFYFPGDTEKGDIARSLFYSDTRYAGNGMSLVDGTPSGNQMGDLESLIAWHYLDIPDEFERRRNHAIYSVTLNPLRTNNRNAYIDHPEFVWSVYVDQMNDSTIYVGDLAPADGASMIDIDLGNVLVGEIIDPIDIMLNKNGDDGTFYRVTPSAGITTNLDGCYQAFAIGTNASSETLTMSFDAAYTDNTGMVFGSVTIDNLDVTNQAGSGKGANDGDDLISVAMSVFNPGNGSFDSGSDLNTLSIDLGTVTSGSGDATQSIDLFNIAADGAFAAPIDVEIISSAGDTSALMTDLVSITDLSSAGMASFDVILDDDNEGMYSATYTLRVYNSRSMFPGDVVVEDLTLNLIGEVAGSSCPADLNGDGMLNFFDVSEFLGLYSSNDPGADFTGDGELNFFDVSAFLGAYSAGCP
ncbi:MAG: endonuclease [Phycisphaerales bacterium JB047]